MQLLLCAVPVSYFLLSAFVSCAALNVSQQYRIYFLFPILFPAIKSFVSINYLDHIDPATSNLLGHTLLIHIVHITSVLYLEKWQLHISSSAWDFHAAYKIWSNPQLLNTHREVPYALNTSGRISAKGPQTRTRFLYERCLHLTVLYLANKYIVSTIFPNAFMPLSIDSFSPAREKYFRRLFLPNFFPGPPVTVHETLLRAVLSIRWIWANVCGLYLAQTLTAILFVIILRFDEPHEWRPLFGSPLDAYSLRRFWSRFWHRLVVRPYMSYGLFISRRVCQLQAHSGIEKVFVAFFVFLLSGAAHALVTWWSVGCGWGVDVWWFLLNAVAAVGETAVIKLWRQRQRQRHRQTDSGSKKKAKELGEKDNHPGRVGRLYRLLGALWVLGFFFWSVPKWEYSKVYCLVQQMEG